MDPAKRLQMYREIQKKLMEDLPAIPLFMMHYATGLRPNVNIPRQSRGL
jgi:ABC-type transport system substrate-binding protein